MPKESQSENDEKIVVKAILEGKNKEMFTKLKEKYNLKYNVEVFNYILKKMYDIEFEKGDN
ncbi:MAG: hypothetical protein ACFFDF_23030 [Candidatus Odinarchaeota archaeon]